MHCLQVHKVLKNLTIEGGLQPDHLELLWNLTEKVGISQPTPHGGMELSFCHLLPVSCLTRPLLHKDDRSCVA